jgi:hypothetical protein
MVLQTSGISAEVNADGPVMNVVPKQGGNTFEAILNRLAMRAFVLMVYVLTRYERVGDLADLDGVSRLVRTNEREKIIQRHRTK